MNTLGLAKLFTLGTVDSRKKLQKVVYLLQCAGANLGADYSLHLYGPYSTDVASGRQILMNSKIIEEERPDGRQYNYTLTPNGESAILNAEQTLDTGLVGHEPLATELLSGHLWTLELASTIAYYHRDLSEDWGTAVQDTAKFKEEEVNSSAMVSASALAKKCCGVTA